MEQKKIGERIRLYRLKKGFTQEQLAEKLDISDKTLARWERGQVAPDMDNIYRIADVLEIDRGEIFIRAERGKSIFKKADIPYTTRDTLQSLRHFFIVFLIWAIFPKDSYLSEWDRMSITADYFVFCALLLLSMGLVVLFHKKIDRWAINQWKKKTDAPTLSFYTFILIFAISIASLYLGDLIAVLLT